jgi:hypothetical protein
MRIIAGLAAIVFAVCFAVPASAAMRGHGKQPMMCGMMGNGKGMMGMMSSRKGSICPCMSMGMSHRMH